MNKFPSWTQVGLLSQLPDLSHIFFFFCLLILFIYAKTHVMNEHFV